MSKAKKLSLAVATTLCITTASLLGGCGNINNQPTDEEDEEQEQTSSSHGSGLFFFNHGSSYKASGSGVKSGITSGTKSSTVTTHSSYSGAHATSVSG